MDGQHHTRTMYHQHHPNIHPSIIPTPFMPMPNINQPFLSPGICIPTQYSRPNPILKYPWPKGNAVHQRSVGPNNAPRPPVSTNATGTVPVQQIPFPSGQQHGPIPTYAQVANPYYHHNQAVPTTHHPPTQYYCQQPLSRNSNIGNLHHGQAMNQSQPDGS